MVTKNFTDFTKNFSCNYCDINCSRKSEWDRHVMTKKHNSNITGNKDDIYTGSEVYAAQEYAAQVYAAQEYAGQEYAAQVYAAQIVCHQILYPPNIILVKKTHV